MLSPHLETGRVLLFVPTGSNEIKAAYLDAAGDLVIAPAEWASCDAGSAEPPASAAGSIASTSPPIARKVVDILRSSGEVEVSVVRIAPDRIGAICHCPRCRARRDAAASADPSLVVEDQASS